MKKNLVFFANKQTHKVLAMSSWIWPTSEDQFHKAERELLRDVWDHNGLEVEQTEVEIAPGNRINTLRVRMKGAEKGAMGPKTTLVFAHGFGSGIGLWHRNIAEIMARCDGAVEILAFDWPGFGRSSRLAYDLDSFQNHFPLPEGSSSPSPSSSSSSSSSSFSSSSSSNDEDTPQEVLERAEKAENYFVESLETWRKKLELDKFVLLGHSLGGYFSSLYALRYPSRVSSLILASPVGMPERPPETSPPRFNSWLVSAFRQSWRLSISPQAFVRTAGPFGPRLVNWFCEKRFRFEGEEAKRVSSYLYHTSAASPSGEYSLFDVLGPGVFAHRPLVHRLTALCPSVPLHFIYGKHDWMDFRSALFVTNARREQMQRVGRGEVYRVSESGHQMYLENSDAFNALVSTLCLKQSPSIIEGVFNVSAAGG